MVATLHIAKDPSQVGYYAGMPLCSAFRPCSHLIYAWIYNLNTPPRRRHRECIRLHAVYDSLDLGSVIRVRPSLLPYLYTGNVSHLALRNPNHSHYPLRYSSPVILPSLRRMDMCFHTSSVNGVADPSYCSESLASSYPPCHSGLERRSGG